MPKVNYRDPAPSRLAYRMQRLLLTPLFRRFLRSGLPIVAMGAALAIAAADEGRREAVGSWIAEVKREIQQRPEFMVKLMAIDGASDGLAEDIREVLQVDFPISSWDLDLPAMQAKVAGLDAVRAANLRVRGGGILQVAVSERVPVAVWRTAEGLELLDRTGHRVAPIAERADRADLPLLAGRGAAERVPEAMRLLSAATPIEGRLRGLVRVGERRWDMVLDRRQRIELPETEPVQALEQVMALHQTQDLLDRAVTIVDMRNPGRPTLRLAEHARAQFFDAKETSERAE